MLAPAAVVMVAVVLAAVVISAAMPGAVVSVTVLLTGTMVVDVVHLLGPVFCCRTIDITRVLSTRGKKGTQGRRGVGGEVTWGEGVQVETG